MAQVPAANYGRADVPFAPGSHISGQIEAHNGAPIGGVQRVVHHVVCHRKIKVVFRKRVPACCVKMPRCVQQRRGGRWRCARRRRSRAVSPHPRAARRQRCGSSQPRMPSGACGPRACELAPHLCRLACSQRSGAGGRRTCARSTGGRRRRARRRR